MNNMNKTEILKKCFAFMDLTTLRPEDTENSVKNLVDKVSEFHLLYPSYPLPASICVYPNFAHVVRDHRISPELHVTTVAGCFPSSQSFPQVKELEVKMAIEDGADEVDIVLALNAFLAGDKERAYQEIARIKDICTARGVLLKVILETGILKTEQLIHDASMLAMEAGADFIKTSTGKVSVNATPEAARVMCYAIKEYYEKTGRKVGFKAAGGVSTADEALQYYEIGESILGAEWLNKNLFRFGVSRLGNSLVSAIENEEIKFF